MIHATDCPRKLPKKLPNGSTTVVNLPCNRWTCDSCFPKMLQDEIDDITAHLDANVRGLTFTLRSSPDIMTTWNLLRNRMRREHPAAKTWLARHTDKDGDEHIHGIALQLPREWFQQAWRDVRGTYFEAKPLAGRSHAARCVNYILQAKHTGQHIHTARSRNWKEAQSTSGQSSQSMSDSTSQQPDASTDDADLSSQGSESNLKDRSQSPCKTNPQSSVKSNVAGCAIQHASREQQRTQLLDAVFKIATADTQHNSNDTTLADVVRMLPPDDRKDPEFLRLVTTLMQSTSDDKAAERSLDRQIDAAKLWLTFTTPVPKEKPQ